MKTSYIRITAPINTFSAQRIFELIDKKYEEGIEEVRLLLSTPGGSVAAGISIYNYLIGLPIRVVTHNFGVVDSIGVILYCAGHERLCVPNARFLLHPVGMDIQKNTRVDELWLKESWSSIQTDQKNIAAIIASVSGLDSEQVIAMINSRQSFSSQEALSKHLVTRMEKKLLPAQSDLSVVLPEHANGPANLQDSKTPQFNVQQRTTKSMPRYETNTICYDSYDERKQWIDLADRRTVNLV